MSSLRNDQQTMSELLERWVSNGWLRQLDRMLVVFFLDQVEDMPPLLMLATALVSHQLGQGHVCLDLAALLESPAATLALPPERDEQPFLTRPTPLDLLQDISLSDWVQRMRHPDLLFEDEGGADPDTQRLPLVLRGQRLYLARYWRHERQVEEAIRARLAAPAPSWDERRGLGLNQLFPNTDQDRPDWQKIACAMTLRRRFGVITGGPGTGKTTTVVRLLALILAYAPPGSALPRIRLAAPTGKAAARLKASIQHAVLDLPQGMLNDEALKAMPDDVSTLHRLLGSLPDSRRFRHDARNPLPLDVLVVDEASMVDLEMAAALLQALPCEATLILLGDKDQLASVEAGSVLGALCQRAEGGHFLPENAAWVHQITGDEIPQALQDPAGTALDQSVVMLRHSHRFARDSGIGRLADAVNHGADSAMRALWQDPPADLARHHLAQDEGQGIAAWLLGQQLSIPGLTDYWLKLRSLRPPTDQPDALASWALAVLSAQRRFQLLCALRQGPCGVEGVNQHVEAGLRQMGLIRHSGEWYEGRPIMVTRNDGELGLMNGDIGMTLRHPLADASGQVQPQLRVAFAAPAFPNGVHWVAPSRLNAVETVYALTVHKSQGSEFEHVALLMPSQMSPVLTRELIYTAITRAQSRFTLLTTGCPTIFEEAAQRVLRRSGGLLDPVP